MIDHYDNLPDVSVFMHSERYQWHNDDPIYGTLLPIHHLFPPLPITNIPRWSLTPPKSSNPLHQLPRLRQPPLRLDPRLPLRAQARRHASQSPRNHRPQIRQNNRNGLPLRLQRALPRPPRPRNCWRCLLRSIRSLSGEDPRETCSGLYPLPEMAD